MKNTILFSLLFLLSLQAISQRSKKNDYAKENFFRVGFKTGINVNKVEGRSFKNEFKYNYSLGSFLQFNFSRKFGFQPEINFVQASAEQSNDFSDIYDDISLGGSQLKAKMNYLKTAGLLNLNVGPTQRIKLQFGPQWGMLIKEKVDSLKTSKNIFKSNDFSVVGGLMIQFPFVHMGVRYERGLTNINDIDNRDKWKSQAWYLFAGITF